MGRFDYVIIGAGSAGCVLANRLSEDGGARVLLLEAGGRDWQPQVRMPLGMPLAKEDRRISWNFETEPEPHCHDRRIRIPRGRVLGGTSSINAMIYARGHPLDYDEWRQMGLEGWGYADLLPYFKRSEWHWRGETEYHGGGGLLKVSPNGMPTHLHRLVSDAAAKVGFDWTDDYNGAEPEGVALPDFTIAGGRRYSTARAFLRPAMKRPNLTVETRALAHRVIVRGGRAVGVEYMKNGRLHTAYADREVVLSGGTYNSPQLLMLSGIGAADELQALGIPPVLDLPGVGRNLQDHVNIVVNFDINQPVSQDPVSQDGEMRFDRLAASALQWALLGTGFAASFPTHCIGFLRTQEDSVRPDIELLLSAIAPDARPWFPGIIKPVGDRFSSRVAVLHPHSRGSVRLRSADPAASPRISWNLFDDPADLVGLRNGVKAVRAIFAEEPLKSLVAREVNPGPQTSTDSGLDEYLRRNCETAHHGAGTCRMGTDSAAVVDGELRVNGIGGLRVADCSVMPKIVGSNTNAPAIMIAEKAADFIRGRPIS